MSDIINHQKSNNAEINSTPTKIKKNLHKIPRVQEINESAITIRMRFSKVKRAHEC